MDNKTIKLITQNAAKLQELYEKWVSDEFTTAEYDRWYDQLSFPGGLTHGIDLLKNKNPNTIENAIAFLAVDPRFFRSGYIKETILKLLKKAPISPSQKTELQKILLSQIEKKPSREYRAYCNLAAAIQDDTFKNQIEKIATNSSDNIVKQQAQRMLDALNKK
jgi:hypothetical protein